MFNFFKYFFPEYILINKHVHMITLDDYQTSVFKLGYIKQWCGKSVRKVINKIKTYISRQFNLNLYIQCIRN